MKMYAEPDKREEIGKNVRRRNVHGKMSKNF